MKLYCHICDTVFRTESDYQSHMSQHVAVERMSADDSNFIPEVERDESGKIKPKPYKQQKWEPADSEYGG